MDVEVETLRERRRSASIRLYGLEAAGTTADAPDLGELDEIVALTRQTLEVGGAGVNLFVDDTQVTVAGTGPLPEPVPRARSICSTLVRSDEAADLLEVPDLSADPRFAHSPFVDGRECALRFYAAAPLHGKHGLVLGTLCVWDATAQTLDERRRALLRTFGRSVVNVLDQRRRALVPDHSGALRTAPISLRGAGA